MTQVTIPNRPFATEPITGMMLPDGIFEASVGRQNINAHVENSGASATDVDVYVESVSDPGISVDPETIYVEGLESGATSQLSWEADFSNATPGTHRVSFMVDSGSGGVRVLKKIFVTQTTFDEASKTAHVETPEGTMQTRFEEFVEPRDSCCKRRRGEKSDRRDIFAWVREFESHDRDFEACMGEYLPLELEASVTPDQPYEGQYGDLPFEDPWWKIALWVLCVVLLIAAAIAASQQGGTVGVSVGGGQPTGSQWEDCNDCGIQASGGSSSYVVAGLVAAAAGAATVACLSDERDPFRRGQDNTPPDEGELTVEERLDVEMQYPEPVALGRPFAVNTQWTYTRVTDNDTYTYSVSETNTNQHVLSGYEVDAPDELRSYGAEPLVISAKFFDENGERLVGDDLFVQCILDGPNGEFFNFPLHDDGTHPDEKANDGVYTARFDLLEMVRKGKGTWRYFVVAQDVNDADPNLDPEEAAKIIGGAVLTHQLEITFDEEDDCQFRPDGHFRVV